MPNLMPTDIKDEVRNILEDIPANPGGHPYVTAYQIMERLSETTKNRLIAERGRPGKDSGKYYAAANVVSDAAEMIHGIDIAFLETSNMRILLNDEPIITPGNQNVGLYRIIITRTA